MYQRLIALILTGLFLSVPAMADKPEWAGKGKPTAEQKEAHKATMQAKGDEGDDRDDDDRDDDDKAAKDKKGKKGKKGDEDSGEGMKAEEEKQAGAMEKQREMKTEQERNELGKGSDQGQEKRETSRKWWKFWGDE